MAKTDDFPNVPDGSELFGEELPLDGPEPGDHLVGLMERGGGVSKRSGGEDRANKKKPR